MYHFNMISFCRTKEEKITLTERECRDVTSIFLRQKFFPELTMCDVWTEVYIENDKICEASIHPHKEERIGAKTKRVLTEKDKLIWSLIEELEAPF